MPKMKPCERLPVTTGEVGEATFVLQIHPAIVLLPQMIESSNGWQYWQ
jgi:hypothetical protein